MARINTNVTSMIAQNNLARSSRDMNLRLERLATGLRINRGADDPAGLIVSERLRTEIKGLGQSIKNSERASAVIATAEGALAEVADLLNSVKGLIIEAANTGGVSKEEVEANQLQINSALESITRISNTASFAGLQLLNGAMEYQTSGIPTSAIAATNIFSAQFGNQTSVPVSVEVVASAQTASLFLSGNTAGSAGAMLSSVTVEISGNRGVTSLSFVSGTTLSAVVAAVNTITDSTGVSAALVSATNQTSGLTFNSVGFGSNDFVSVRKVGNTGDFFDVADQQGGNITTRDEGQDVVAIINGTIGRGDGLQVAVSSPSLSVELLLTQDYAQTIGSVKSFDITGGGSIFQIGPNVNANQQVGFGISSIAASRIGGTSDSTGGRHFLDSIKSGGNNSLVSANPDFALTADIVDSAISEVSVLRGRLGAFERNTLQTTMRSLQIGLENITASESQIRDADFAAETANLTRAQILVQAGTSVLATSNANAQNVLSLLQ